MKNINKKYRFTVIILVVIFSITSLSGCKKFLDIPLPTDQTTADAAFVSDNSTSAVVTGIFYNMYGAAPFSGSESIGYRAAFYTDELRNIDPGNTGNIAFYTNSLQGTNTTPWAAIYKWVYQANLAIEGIQATTYTLNNKNQWLGEALFSRALCYYYLVNLYGDVPLLLKSDVIANNKTSRNPKAEVYTQIFADLKQAQSLLGTVYKDGFSATTTVRARPNQYAATAMLARLYLETGDWVNAEAQATQVINNTAFQLVAPAQTFLATSAETIWALAPVAPGFVREFTTYNNNAPATITGTSTPMSYGISSAMSQSLISCFETGDTRLTTWARLSTTASPAVTYYFPNKYKSNVNGNEFVVVLRLAEQYLIRAEARAQQNKLTGTSSAITDLNAVRTRAGLAGTAAVTQADILSALQKERRTELFTEFGFRFFDLKRTGKIDEVMNVTAPLKAAVWNSQKQVWPIPTADMLIDGNLKQNPGYQ